MPTKDIREASSLTTYLLRHLEQPGVALMAANAFGITRQAVNETLRQLTRDQVIRASGSTRNRTYELVSLTLCNTSYELLPGLQEDAVWSSDISPALASLPKNVRSIWNFCFTEMFNNALDHSEGSEISVVMEGDRLSTELTIHDDGVGIFRKIQMAAGLADERQAVLELLKGKFTTDRSRHSGLGVFFSSRMLDSFVIASGSVYLSLASGKTNDWVMEEEKSVGGTTLFMKLSNSTERTTTGVFEQFGDGVPLGFTKTIIPLALAQYGNEELVSRSQAKRILSRGDQFKQVVLDFRNVETIGQGFADEVFRVYVNANPAVRLAAINMVPSVKQMVAAVQEEAARQAKAGRRRGALPA